MTDLVDHTAPVRVNQLADQLARMSFDDSDLPVRKLNPALVLLAGPMLWKQARPLFRAVGDPHARASMPKVQPNTPGRHDSLDRLLAVGDDAGIPSIERHGHR
jgi:hypothetical protein